MLLDDCSWYRASRFVGKFRGKSVGDIWLIEGVEGRESVSGNVNSVVSDEMSIGSFTNMVHLGCMSVVPNLVDIQ